jgi:type III secretion protein T
MITESLLSVLYGYLAGLPRIGLVFLMIPLFGRRTVRGLVRNEFVLVLALLVYPIAIAAMPTDGWSVYRLLVTAAREALIGLALGIALGTIFWVAENVGYLIDLQVGTQNATVFDPVHEHEEAPMAVFMLQWVIALFLAGGGLTALLGIVFESYRVWPVDSPIPDLDQALASVMTTRLDTLFEWILRFAAPVIILLLLIEAGLGLVNRFAQEIDVYTLAMPIKSMVALLVLVLFASFLSESIQQAFGPDSELSRLLARLYRDSMGKL